MKPEHIGRYRLMATIFSIAGLFIIGQLIRFQFDLVNAPKLENQWKWHQGGYRTYFPARGLIQDRSGYLLAGNEMVYEVGVVLDQVKNAHTVALALNVVLGLDYAETLGYIQHPPSNGLIYLVLADGITKDKVERLKRYQEDIGGKYSIGGGEGSPSMAGLTFIPHLKRVYPEGELASNIIGFLGKDENGSIIGYYGLEAKYDSVLAGAPVRIWVPNDPKLVQEFPEIPDGTSLILTIDREIQAALEEILENSINETGAESATIVVLDPRNGEILAMASNPRIDLNKYWRYEQVLQGTVPFNRSISQSYEPGSVYKVLTMASAIDAGAVTLETEFLDTGMIEVGGAYIYNWNRGVWGPQTMQGCMQHSLNVCLAWVATELGAKDFYSYMQAFGIGQLTGVDLEGEVAGRLKLPGDSDWYEAELATNAFGQGVAVTPIQLASAVSALANEGKVMVPHVVKAIVVNGNQYETQPRVASIPISASTALTMTEMLARSLEDEASVALIDGYRMAGKTGTAEIPTPTGYVSNVTNASFVGWGPVDAPRFLIFIWLEKPETSIWGSEVAAPIFPKIAEKLTLFLNIPPDKQRRALYGQ